MGRRFPHMVSGGFRSRRGGPLLFIAAAAALGGRAFWSCSCSRRARSRHRRPRSAGGRAPRISPKSAVSLANLGYCGHNMWELYAMWTWWCPRSSRRARPAHPCDPNGAAATGLVHVRGGRQRCVGVHGSVGSKRSLGRHADAISRLTMSGACPAVGGVRPPPRGSGGPAIVAGHHRDRGFGAVLSQR